MSNLKTTRGYCYINKGPFLKIDGLGQKFASYRVSESPKDVFRLGIMRYLLGFVTRFRSVIQCVLLYVLVRSGCGWEACLGSCLILLYLI